MIVLLFSIRYSSEWDLSTPVDYPEAIELLLPGGPGYEHPTGKLDDYCLQYPNGTSIISN